MAKFTARRDAWGRDASRFPRPDSLNRIEAPQCVYRDCCNAQVAEDVPVCARHATYISWRLKELMGQPIRRVTPPRRPPKTLSFVYYLMIGPSTVKIGTTGNLPVRITALRTDMQYVVAIERGGRDIEAQRHREFATDRLGRREDFQLSNRLKEHIEALQAQRDELIAAATANPLNLEAG